MRNLLLIWAVVCVGLMQGCFGSSGGSSTAVEEGKDAPKIVTELPPDYGAAVTYLTTYLKHAEVTFPKEWKQAIIVEEFDGGIWSSFAFVTEDGLWRSSGCSYQYESAQLSALLDVGDHVLLLPRMDQSNECVWHISPERVRIVRKFAYITYKPQ